MTSWQIYAEEITSGNDDSVNNILPTLSDLDTNGDGNFSIKEYLQHMIDNPPPCDCNEPWLRIMPQVITAIDTRIEKIIENVQTESVAAAARDWLPKEKDYKDQIKTYEDNANKKETELWIMKMGLVTSIFANIAQYVGNQ